MGLGVLPGRGPAGVVGMAQTAETAGFDVVSVFHDLGFEPAIVSLTLIAEATERIRLGPAALNPFTCHPFEIAAQIAALDVVSGGRAYCGLVTGAWLDELGLREERPVRAMREAVEIVRRALAGDRTGFSGERFTLAPGRGLDFALQRSEVPLLIGTWKPRLAGLAAEVAAEVKIGGCANPEMVRLMRSWLGEGPTQIVVGATTVVDDDGDRARALAAGAVAMYLPVVGALDPTLELGPGDAVPFDRFTLAGTPAEVARQVEALRAAGAARVEFGPPYGVDGAHGLELLVDRVLPALR